MMRLGGDEPAIAAAALAEWQRDTATRAVVLAAVDEVARVKGIEPPKRGAVPLAQILVLKAMAEFVPLIAEDWARLRLAESLS
jgi:hypothetical protein